MSIRLLPLAVDAVAGGVDGMFGYNDDKANSGKVPGTANVSIQQNQRLYRGGLAAAGLLGGFFMRTTELTDPLLYFGLGGLASELGYHLAAGGGHTTVTVTPAAPATPAGPGGQYAAAARYSVMPALSPAHHAAGATWSDSLRRQPAGAAG